MKYLLFTSLLLFSLKSEAQTYFYGSSQIEDSYFFSIKTIDDFIDRFNNDTASSLMLSLKSKHDTNKFNRTISLATVFNLENPLFEEQAFAKEFYQNILDSNAQKFIHFNDSNWYAEAKCHFTFQKKHLEIPLILKVEDLGGLGVKWMITGVGDLPSTGNEKNLDTTKSSENKIRKSIPPSNSSVNFLALRRIFGSSFNEQECFDSVLLTTERCKKFIQLINNQSLQFEYASEIKFHFLQLPGWIFSVEEFNRKSRNSGFLINTLLKADLTKKETYLKQLLHR